MNGDNVVDTGDTNMDLGADTDMGGEAPTDMGNGLKSNLEEAETPEAQEIPEQQEVNDWITTHPRPGGLETEPTPETEPRSVPKPAEDDEGTPKTPEGRRPGGVEGSW